jgi:hypothetical protein
VGMKRAIPALLLLLSVALPWTARARGQDISELRVREAIDDAARGLGQAIAGGSPLTGPAGMTGGLTRFRVGAAATFTDIQIEDPQRASGTVGFVLPAATVNAAVGIWGGSPGTGFGALDLIGRTGPVLAREQIAENPLLLSLGARIGILREGALLPDVSVTVTRTWVDGLTYGEEGDEVSFDGEVRALSGRADVSKSFLLATPYAGVGFDRAQVDAAYRIPDERSSGDGEIRGRVEASGTHSRAYAGVELSLALLAFSVEAGIAGGDTFAAVGARLGF